ncbi:MAG: PilW family protein [Granulosicoccus sp.]
MKNLSKHTSGFSLIELMIAMVLGIVIVGGCISIFTGVVRSSSLNQTVSNLQSNARFALDTIGRDVRAAGFIGCSAERNVALNVTVNNPPTTDLSRSAVTGYVVTDTTWSPQHPQSYTAAQGVGQPVPGTHALSVHYAEFPGFALESSMSSNNSSVELARRADRQLSAGQLMVVSDCSSADLFTISSVTKTNAKVTVSTGASLVKPYEISSDFPDNTRAMPFVSTIYYVGDTQRISEEGDNVYSLYAHSFPYTAANPPLELIEGVDQLVLEFGVRQTDGSMRYAVAGADGYRVEGVETVRVGLLLSSIGSYSEVDATRTYTLAGQSVSALVASSETSTETQEDPANGTPAPAAPTVTLSYPSSKKLRIPFNATFNVRNRNI